MNKYIDRLRSDGVNSLWLFDGNASSYANEGSDIDSLTRVTTLAPKQFPPILQGFISSPAFEAYIDETNSVSSRDITYYRDTSFSKDDYYYNTENSWTSEITFVTGYAQNTEAQGKLNVLWGIGSSTNIAMGLGLDHDPDNFEWTLNFKFQTDVQSTPVISTVLNEFQRYVVTVVKTGRSMVMFVDGVEVGSYVIPDGEVVITTGNDLYVGGEDRGNHSGVWSIGSLMLSESAQPASIVSDRVELLNSPASPTEVIAALGPVGIFVPEELGYARYEPSFDNPATELADMYFEQATQQLLIDPSLTTAGATGTKELLLDMTEIGYAGPVHLTTRYTVQEDVFEAPLSEIEVYYRINDGVIIEFDPDATDDVIPAANDIWGQSTEGTPI